MGGSSSDGTSLFESANTLISDSLLKVTDLLCEGPIKGFALQTGLYGADPLVSTYFNDVQVRNFDGSYNFNVSGEGFAFSWTLGTSNQGPMSGFEHVTCQIPLPSDTKLSNPPSNAGQPKTILATFNTLQYPDADTINVSFRIPQMYTTAKSVVNGYEIDAQIDVSLNNGPFQSLSSGGLQFVGKNTSPYYRTIPYNLPRTTPPSSFYQWTLKIYKTSTDIQSVQTAADIYVDSISVVSASQYNYPNSVLAGLYIDALQFGTVPNRAYLIQGLLVSVPNGYVPTQYNVSPPPFVLNGCDVESGNNNIGVSPQAPTTMVGLYTGMTVTGLGLQPNTYIQSITNGPAYFFSVQPTPTGGNGVPGEPLSFYSGIVPVVAAQYPTVWDGTFQTGVWTDNPAWIFYDFVTNPRYGLGQFINVNNIDIWTLYQMSQFCDELVDAGLGNGSVEPQFTLNAYIKEPADAYNMLLNMASVFRGMLYYANGTIRANLTDNKSPVFNYTNANAIGGAFEYSSTARSARHNAVQVKYTDPTNLYRENYVLIEDNQGIIQYGYNKKEIDAFGCTSIGQATRVANWVLTTERLRTETVSFQVGEDGLYVRPGDVFNLYDNFRMNRSQGGRVVSFDPTQSFVTLDRPVNLDSGCIYGLSCLVPAANFDATGDITGSTQIGLIRNPQIQTREVLNANMSGVSVLQVTGAFSGLMNNTVWILSATGTYIPGYVPTVFEQAPQYECLAITQDSPGILNILALNYNTGINYIVNTGFTTVMNPVNTGNNVAPLPPTHFTGQMITGQLNGGSFYSYLNLTWLASASSTVAGYAVSGDAGIAPQYIQIGTTTSTGLQYISDITGNVDFKVVAIGKGGARSSAASFTYNFPGAPGVDPAQIRFWQLPAAFGEQEQVGVFYNRPSPATVTTNVFYSTSGIANTFQLELDMDFYAAECAVLSGVTSTGNFVGINSTSYDMAQVFSQNSVAQNNNTLLFLVDNELMSVGAVTQASGTNNFTLNVLRGVMGTFGVTHSAAISGWLFYQSQLNAFSNTDLYHVYDGTGGYNTGIATKHFQIQNQTSTIDGPVVPTPPGLSYTLPSPFPSAPTNLSGAAGTGKIVQLTWTPPDNTDIIYYNVYRATGPGFTNVAIIGDDTNTHFNDIGLVSGMILGTPYKYWVTAVDQQEEESAKSVPIIVTPSFVLPSGVNPFPPADPTAMTFNSSSNYFSIDGSLLASITLNVPAMTSGSAYQSIYYTRAGNPLSGAQVGAQLTNTQATTATIFDLSPNVSYAMGNQSISNFGQFSADIVVAAGSPFTAPSGTATPNGTPGSPPGIPSGVTASGGIYGIAHEIFINWLPNGEPNFEEYGVYRALAPTATKPSQPLAYVGANTYNDATVTGGFSYVYWVSAFNRSEQQSALSFPVTGTTLGPPQPDQAPTLAASGIIGPTPDGNLFAYLTFNVFPLPTAAIGHYLLYRTDSTTGNWSIGNDLSNTTTTTAQIPDLTPGVLYDVAVQPYTINGVTGAVVAAVGSPFKAPVQNAKPQAPTGVFTMGPGLGEIPSAYGTFLTPIIQPAVKVYWSGVSQTNIAYYEAILSAPSQLDNNAPAPYGGGNSSTSNVFYSRVPANVTGTYLYAISPIFVGNNVYVRSVDRNGNWSPFADGGSINSTYNQTYAGNIGSQNYSAAQVSQVQINAITNASAVKIANLSPQFGAITVGGPNTYPAASAAATFNVTPFGFGSVPPEGCTITLDAGTHIAQYRKTLSTSTTATFTIFSSTNTADINSGDAFNASMQFFAYN